MDTPAISEPANGTWTPAELRAAMLKSRGKVDLDLEARFYLLVVKNINSKAMERVMFDFGGAFDPKKAREGVAVATDWVVSKTGWGAATGQKWGSLPAPIFRSAVHEIGHVMNLKHRPFTQPLWTVATALLSLERKWRPSSRITLSGALMKKILAEYITCQRYLSVQVGVLSELKSSADEITLALPEIPFI